MNNELLQEDPFFSLPFSEQLRQIDQLGSRAKFLAATPCPPHYESTHIAPSLWDIGDLAALKHVSEAIFGPVLQLARVSAAQWDELADQINAL